jgi:hypothetical protein
MIVTPYDYINDVWSKRQTWDNAVPPWLTNNETLSKQSNLFHKVRGARGQFCLVDHVCISDLPFNQKIHKASHLPHCGCGAQDRQIR